MKFNYEIFERDPRSANLANDGQARLVPESESDKAMELLRYELKHFVCEGQYAKGMQQILESYLTNLSANAQRASWVSGFYGSGKSHLLKMISHLWMNTSFPDGSDARSLTPDLTSDIQAALRELDTAGRKCGGGVFAVSGSMPEGSSISARLTVLGILFRSCGLPAAYNQATFCMYLKKQGFYDQVRKQIEDAGREFHRELTDLYVSPYIRKALLAVDEGLGDEREVRQLLREQFPNPQDINTSDFIRITREVLTLQGGGSIPLTAFILDEAQHYIGDDKDRSREITELTEALNKQMDSKVLVVMAGQNALTTDTPQFAWLKDRFTIRVELSDADVETVTRKVLLAKKPEAVTSLEQTLESHSGEIERHLVKSRIGPTTKDQEFLVPDYPILPTRRRFWEAALRSVDPTGSSSLLRTQLRITHEALREVADKPVGHTIPGDFMFFQQQTPLVQQGVLPREISDRILRLDAGSGMERLKARICGLVFLIRKIPREKAVDIHVRATEDMLADLLIDDLGESSIMIRKELPVLLQELVDDGVLLFDGDEYNLQTRESAEWDDKFKVEQAKARQDIASLNHERKSRLHAATEQALKNVNPRQGAMQTPRKLKLHFGGAEPEIGDGEIPVWIRDGWDCKESEVLNAARAAGADSPIVFAFLPEMRKDNFRDNLIRMKAAQAVLDLKGVPTSREAEEARDMMETRRKDAERNVEVILREVIGAAKAFKGGGTELHALELIDKVEDGIKDGLDRLFPRFAEADHKAWSVVKERARKGDDSPLQVIGWKDATAEHPVCKEIEHEVGPGKEGRHIRATFSKPPYGWNQDAIDGALIALHAAGNLVAIDGNTHDPIAPRHLEQNRIAKAQFRTENVTLGQKERIAIKGLFQSAKLSVKPEDDLSAKASEFLDRMEELAGAAGGEAPLPERPSRTHLQDLRHKSGNEQLSEILKQSSVLQQQAGDWKKLADLTEKRLPAWQRLETLLRCGEGIKTLDSVRDSRDAIRKDRLLLDGSDHVAPLIKKSAEALRSELTTCRESYSTARQQQLNRLEGSDLWQKLEEPQRADLLRSSPLPETDQSSIATEEELIHALQRLPLSHWRDRTDALSARVDSLLAAAAKLLEPKAHKVTLPGATIKDEAELDAWLDLVRVTVIKEMQKGPVIL